MKKNAKKLISLCLATAFLVLSMLSVSATEYVERVVGEDFNSAYQCKFLAPGDLDANGAVNAEDTARFKNMLLSGFEDDSYQAVHASHGAEAKYTDVNGDGNVDIRDLVRQKKNMADNFIFVKDGVIRLNGNSAYNGGFISVIGSGAHYKISYTYKSDSQIKVKINGLDEEIVFVSEASSDYITVTKTFETPLTLNATDGIEFQIIGEGLVESIAVTRINMDNDLVENW